MRYLSSLKSIGIATNTLKRAVETMRTNFNGFEVYSSLYSCVDAQHITYIRIDWDISIIVYLYIWLEESASLFLPTFANLHHLELYDSDNLDHNTCKVMKKNNCNRLRGEQYENLVMFWRTNETLLLFIHYDSFHTTLETLALPVGLWAMECEDNILLVDYTGFIKIKCVVVTESATDRIHCLKGVEELVMWISQ